MGLTPDEPAPIETNLDEPALERMYARLERPVFNVVYRWLWNSQDAHEVVQEAFARLWGMRDRVRPATADALLYRIAINLASKRRRRKRLWGLRPLAAEPASDRLAADLQIEDAQRAAALRLAVEALPERQRAVVALTELSGLSYAQVAGILEIPEGTVASRRHAAIKRLRAALSEVP